MLQALKLKSQWTNCFISFPDKEMIDLFPPKPESYKNTDWKELQGKIISNKNVILTRYGDIYPFINVPIFECENLIIDECDKNFIAYWLNKQIFPNVRKVYIASCISDPHVLRETNFQEIYLHECNFPYKEKWWSNFNNIKLINDTDYQKIVNSYTNEEMIFA